MIAGGNFGTAVRALTANGSVAIGYINNTDPTNNGP
jgi:hypothetical protein